MRRWYAIRSKARKEETLFRLLQSHNYEVFYPRVRVNPVNPRAARLRPYFPGYLFVHVDLAETGVNAFQWMPFAIGLVSFGSEPAAVPETIIDALGKRLQEINAAGGLRFDGLEAGQPVKITGGPFAGYTALFDHRLPGSERVRVLLNLLSDRQVPVELHVGQITAEKAALSA